MINYHKGSISINRTLQVAGISLLFVGAIIGTYLVQQKTSFFPHAASAPTCNTTGVSLSTQVGYLPNTNTRAVAFVIAGDASTYINDNYGGGVTACSGEWNSKICEVASEGVFTWTHSWKHCVGTVTNCSVLCNKSISYTIPVIAVTPTPTPLPPGVATPTPTAMLTPTPTLIQSWPTSTPTPTQLRPTPTSAIIPTVAVKAICSVCTADIDGDTKVTAVDFAIYRTCLNKQPSDLDGQGRSCAKTDINGDGAINSLDVSCIIKNFSKYCR